jgi:hypothetical protein
MRVIRYMYANMKEVEPMSFTIRWNIRTAHLQGVVNRTVYTGDGEDNGSGVVPYYAESACAALTRSGFRMAVADTLDTLADALTVLRDFAESRGLKVCANCERAAVAALEADYDVAELKAREAARRLDTAEDFEDEPRIAIAEEHAERLADEYADLAAVIGRCRIFGCEAPTHEASAWCEEHTDRDDTEDTASAIEAETAARHEADNAARMVAAVERVDPAVAAAGRASTVGKAYTPTGESYSGCEAHIHHNGVGSPCARPRGHKGRGGTAHRTTTGIEWMPGQTRPLYCPYARTTAGCDDCKEHAALADRLMESGQAKTYAEAEALAVAMEEEPEAFAPLTVDPEAAYAARRAIYRTASDLYEEHGGEAKRDAAAAAWNAFVAAARLAGKCIDFTCYADAEPGADHCQRHHKRVTARLDHTEPGKAIALIEGGHGREHAPQAWLAHEGGSWLLVDDYDGDTLNVKGPDAERAVHAWAALLGLRIDALAVEVEYAGGPVSPPVREPEAPVAPLNWVWAGSGPAADVHEARGRAHDYQVTEHADAAGASLVAFLRGTTVDTYRRGYMTADDARKAAESYEARYGSVYVPAE